MNEPHGIDKGLIYSFPVRCKNGAWEIVQGLSIDPFSQEKMKATEKELSEERDFARRIGAAARHTVMERFTVSHMVHRTMEVYRQVVP